MNSYKIAAFETVAVIKEWNNGKRFDVEHMNCVPLQLIGTTRDMTTGEQGDAIVGKTALEGSLLSIMTF